MADGDDIADTPLWQILSHNQLEDCRNYLGFIYFPLAMVQTTRGVELNAVFYHAYYDYYDNEKVGMPSRTMIPFIDFILSNNLVGKELDEIDILYRLHNGYA